MTVCNRCGSPMVPEPSALISALMCVNPQCRRMIPRTGVRPVRGRDRTLLNRALRAHRRSEFPKEEAAWTS